MLAAFPLAAFVATTRPAEALVFYRDVLGLALVEETPFALVFDAGGTPLRVQKVAALTPHPFTALGWNVPDVAAVIDSLTPRGVRMERYGHFAQDERGIWDAPGGARIAWFKDPDGNTLSLAQLEA